MIIPLASLLGLGLGALVAHVAREELEEGRKYIRTVGYFLSLATITALVLTLPFPSKLYQLGFGIILLIINMVEIFTQKPSHIPIVTPLLLFISLFFVPSNLVLIPSSLFLLLGIPIGTQVYDACQKS